MAESACRGAGKRLCTPEEFVYACRGEQDRNFPYGDDYEQDACNVFRPWHPAAELHGNAAVGHLDPRLNRVEVGGAPLARRTGVTPRAAAPGARTRSTTWSGTWTSGSTTPMARRRGILLPGTRAGCDSLIEGHPKAYLDYSLASAAAVTPCQWAAPLASVLVTQVRLRARRRLY